MVNVVNASRGTGKAASNNYVTLAGKTGTGQVASADKRYLAWFAGFVPYENPEYAFAVLYEGDPGETIGGGRIAAPLAGRFFNAVYRKKKRRWRTRRLREVRVAINEGRPAGQSPKADHDRQPRQQPAEESKKRNALASSDVWVARRYNFCGQITTH